jgi:Cu(I)/Ag(I) efflux system membrane fusion protein
MNQELPQETHEEPLPEGEEEAPPGVRAMAVLRWALVALMALAAAASLVSFYGGFSAGGPSAGSDALYYCPMHPQIVQDHPGDCPICSMTLVPKPEAGAAAQAGARPGAGVPGLVPITLGPERIQLLGMRTARVRHETLAAQLRTVGFVTADEESLSKIPTRFSGWIEKLFVAQTGQTVKKGQVLAAIYSPELLSAQQELLTARAWAGEPGAEGSETRQMTASLVEDARRRLELFGISKEEIRSIEKSGQPLRALPVRSPVAGTIVRKDALLGAHVQPGTVLFEVADLRSVWVLADLYESDLARVRLGQAARLQLAAYPGQTFPGTVDFLYPALDPATRTRRVRLEFDNRDGRLLPGMYGDVFFELPGQEALLVPAESVVDTGETQYVFLAREGGAFEPRRVKLGRRSGPELEVLEGLEEGETVVTTANFLIDSESRLHAAIEGLGAERTDVPIDRDKFPDKFQQWLQCEAEHRGMGTMEEDCKNAIPKPWK